MADTLTEDEARARLQDVPGWTIEDEKLHREFHFKDFGEAFGFMARVALAAEKLEHHPDWSNSWNTVVIDIFSHADGGITDQCFELANRINRAAGED